jgi:hypothetical protein
MTLQTPASRRHFFSRLLTQCVRAYEHGHASGVFGNQGYDLTTPAGARAVLCAPARYPIQAAGDVAVAAFTRLPSDWSGAAAHFATTRLCVLADTPAAQNADRLIMLDPPADYVAPCPVLLVFNARTHDSAAMSLIQIARQPEGSDIFFGDMDWYPDSPLTRRILAFTAEGA